MKESNGSLIPVQDPITGLFRRDIVFSKLDELISQRQNVVVALIEIHRFKTINDGVGVEVGDRLIKRFARRLQRAVPNGTILGRMGGDGFAIILQADTDTDKVLNHVLEVSRRPFSIKGNIVVTTSSLGIAVGPQHGENANELIRAADIALHFLEKTTAQKSYFESSMLRDAESLHLLENDLRYSVVMEKPELIHAVTSKQFEVFYQPQVCAITRKVVGLEALMRWRHPERGYVSPDVFIPLAEELGLMELLGAWILRKACQDLQSIRQNPDNKNLTLSINISPVQLENATELITKIDKALTDSNFPAENLILEITENTVFHTKESEINTILEHGCNLALDDFGTGFSSMNVLRSLPFKAVKLDKVFLAELDDKNVENTQKAQDMINAFQCMCDALNLKTTIEGVELETQVEFLQLLGCDVLQGFLFSPPMPLQQTIEFLSKQGVS